MQAKKAVILLGGKGTRLRELFPDIPKALAPVAGRPFLAWQIERLFAGNVSSILLAAGYKGDKIRGWVSQQSFHERVSVSIEPEPLGTGGALKYLTNILGQNSFWTLNGDSLLPELNFREMERNHGKSGTLGTIAVTKIENAGRYGTVVFDDNGKIIRFEEKGSKTAGWVNGGVYLLEPSVLSFIKANRNISIEHDVFPQLAAAGKLSVFQCSPPLLDMGTPEGLQNMENHLRRCKKTQN